MPEKNLTYIEHFSELRWLLTRSVLAFLAAFVAYIVYYREISIFLRNALSGIHLIYLSPVEYMAAIFSLAVILGLITIVPYLLVEIYLFIRPALTPRENIFAVLMIPAILISLTGIIYLLYAYMPPLLRFMLSSQAGYTMSVLSFNAVVDFLWIVGLTLFINSILPVAVIALARILGIPKAKWLAFRPYVLIGSFLAGGLITTDDNALVQVGFALWVFILYNIGIIFARDISPNE